MIMLISFSVFLHFFMGFQKKLQYGHSLIFFKALFPYCSKEFMPICVTSPKDKQPDLCLLFQCMHAPYCACQIGMITVVSNTQVLKYKNTKIHKYTNTQIHPITPHIVPRKFVMLTVLPQGNKVTATQLFFVAKDETLHFLRACSP